MKLSPFRIALLCAVLFTFGPLSARAELLYATDGFSIVQFDSLTPGTIIDSADFTGLQAGETIVGFDLRPSNGLLYGIGSTSRVYVINPLSGLAMQVGTLPFTPVLNGNGFGVDFNPVPDRIRVISDLEQNLRINPADGTAINDPALNPAGNVVAAAYSNNFAGATTTTLYGIDSNSGNLVIINNPNAGGPITIVGSLFVSALTNGLGFDISGLTGIAYAVLNFIPPGVGSGGDPVDGLYTINLATGVATPVGQIGDGEFDYIGLTAATAVPEPSSFMLLGGAAVLFGVYRRFRRAQS